MGKLDGKVAIVTGASRGIGKAVALGFAREGALVAVVSRTTDESRSRLAGSIFKTADEIKAAGGKALAIQANVVEESEVQAAVQKVLDEWGRIDILVNNAAVASPGKFEDATTKRWNLVIGVNLLGTFLCCKAVLPVMKRQGSGSIINTSSRAADDRVRSLVGIAYGTAKAAIEHFTCELAAELSPFNIAVNCYKPSRPVATEGFVSNLPDDYDRKQLTTPHNMVKAAVFLAAQNARGVTGCVATNEEYIQWHNL